MRFQCVDCDGVWLLVRRRGAQVDDKLLVHARAHAIVDCLDDIGGVLQEPQHKNNKRATDEAVRGAHVTLCENTDGTQREAEDELQIHCDVLYDLLRNASAPDVRLHGGCELILARLVVARVLRATQQPFEDNRDEEKDKKTTDR